MAWNEPGDDKDPWKRNSGNQKPPELDEVVKKLQKRFGSVLSGRGGPDVPPIPGFVKFLLLGALLAAVLFASRFTVDAGAKGVVQRFGKFHHIAEPGWNWRIPGVDKVSVVRVDLSQEFDTKNEMLTGDANIVSISINVQYRHANSKDFVFNVRSPDETLREVTDASIRAIAGKYELTQIQGEFRDKVAQETRVLIQSNLDTYGAGIIIDAVNLNRTEFPEPVQPAAQDVIEAERDKERYIVQAETYANKLLPRSKGEASRTVENANAYKQKLIAEAQGEANRFLALLKQYEAAPNVTRERLYLETIESVYANTSKVLMDTDSGNNLLYLPVDKIMENAGSRSSGISSASSAAVERAISSLTEQVTKSSAPPPPQSSERSRTRDRN